MHLVKRIQVPDDVFEDLEALRRSLGVSRTEVLRRLLKRERARRAFLRFAAKQMRGGPLPSEEEAMALAVEETRAVRTSHRTKASKT